MGEKHLKVETKLGECSSVAYANHIPFKLYLSLVNRMCLLRVSLILQRCRALMFRQLYYVLRENKMTLGWGHKPGTAYHVQQA